MDKGIILLIIYKKINDDNPVPKYMHMFPKRKSFQIAFKHVMNLFVFYL